MLRLHWATLRECPRRERILAILAQEEGGQKDQALVNSMVIFTITSSFTSLMYVSSSYDSHRGYLYVCVR